MVKSLEEEDMNRNIDGKYTIEQCEWQKIYERWQSVFPQPHIGLAYDELAVEGVGYTDASLPQLHEVVFPMHGDAFLLQNVLPVHHTEKNASFPVQKEALTPDNAASSVNNTASLVKAARGRGKSWTTNEHRLFLLGLKKYGRGKWKKISELVIGTKSPAQVASHAQKFFDRQNVPPNKKKRKSIHDTNGISS
ncbi:hypothetical protein Fmac_004809 [Flemingia macrophylla]|uniref:Uncharacterized protein n=1 Tax=Flemingia macrophylla TaxID=520843 RepID=A0ABD1N5Z7_9FABA